VSTSADAPVRPHRFDRALVLPALGIIGFSLTLPTTKIAVRGMEPLLAASGRAVVATVLAVASLRAARRPRPTAAQARALLLVAGGVVLGFPLLTAYAIRHVPASHGAVVIGLLPLATAGLAVVRIGERPSPRYWACSALGLGAVVLFAVHEGGGSLHVADLLLVGAVAVAAVGYMEGALLAHQMPGWAVVSWALVLSSPATVGLAAVSLSTGGLHHPTAGQWTAFLYTAWVSMFVGFFAWYAGLARAGIARAGQLQLLQPVLTILWSWPLLGERVTAAAALTAAAVLTAVAIGRKADIVAAVEAPPPA
jgi:drug/metabolite transporter (DMT)-like permease